MPDVGGFFDATPRLEGEGGARHVTLPLFEEVAGLAHAFTVAGSDDASVVRAVAGRALPLWTLRQVHGREVRWIDSAGPQPWSGLRPEGDALLTRRRGEAIGIRVADCVPILLCDPRRGILGAVHAGWRGMVAGVLRAAIAAMTAAGAQPRDIRLAMGPAIGACCFEVGPEVVQAFRAADPQADRSIHAGPRPRIDLLDANRRQAVASGVPEAQIASAGLCTQCRAELLVSYRRSGGGAGRMTGLIAWRT